MWATDVLFVFVLFLLAVIWLAAYHCKSPSTIPHPLPMEGYNVQERNSRGSYIFSTFSLHLQPAGASRKKEAIGLSFPFFSQGPRIGSGHLFSTFCSESGRCNAGGTPKAQVLWRLHWPTRNMFVNGHKTMVWINEKDSGRQSGGNFYWQL